MSFQALGSCTKIISVFLLNFISSNICCAFCLFPTLCCIKEISPLVLKTKKIFFLYRTFWTCTHWCINLAALRNSQFLLLAKCFLLQLMQRGVICSHGLLVILQIKQKWSLNKCAAVQNQQALIKLLFPICPNFWQFVHYVIGETFKYLITLIATPAIKISFCLKFSCFYFIFLQHSAQAIKNLAI